MTSPRRTNQYAYSGPRLAARAQFTLCRAPSKFTSLRTASRYSCTASPIRVLAQVVNTQVTRVQGQCQPPQESPAASYSVASSACQRRAE